MTGRGAVPGESPNLARSGESTFDKRSGHVNPHVLVLLASGIVVGVGAAFTGLGGGFLMVPFLLFLGFTAQRAVGTSFLAILIISISAVLAHHKLQNIDYKVAVLLGLGGVIGAQIGARIVEHVSTGQFRRLFAVLLVCVAGYLFFKK